MRRFITLRYFVIAALVLVVGIGGSVSAASTPLNQQFHRQDLGDNDGDGIPNHLDPYDNNQDTPENESPLPIEEEPADDDNSSNESDQTAPALPGPATESGTTQSAAPPPVLSLPNTGTGTYPTSIHAVATLILSVILAGFIAMRIQRQPGLR